MNRLTLACARLDLRLQSTEEVLARIAALPAEFQAQVSPAWIEQLKSQPPSPWTHAFAVMERASGAMVGSCAFKGPPADGTVEIAYEIAEEHQGRGYAKEAARALVEFAKAQGVALVLAHTLTGKNPSTSVLEANGFTFVGEVIDPEDGPVWRWELAP